MKIEFQDIEYFNMFSFGSGGNKVTLNSHPTTLFIGDNGAGKSSGISDVLAFALFGRAHRDITKGTLVNTINEKKALVRLRFVIGSKQYQITRGIKPNVFEVLCDGVPVQTGAAAAALQAYLEDDILHMNFKAFCQVVVIGKASYTPFMRLSTPDRRQFIENILDLSILTEMNIILKKQAKDLEVEIAATKNSLDMTEFKITNAKRVLAEIEKSNDSRVAELNAEIEVNNEKIVKENVAVDRLKAEIETIKALIEALTTKTTDLPKFQEKVQKLRTFEAQITTNRTNVQRIIDFFSKNDNCPTCTQVITTDLKKIKVDDNLVEVAKFTKGLELLKTQMTDAVADVQKVQAVQSEITRYQSDISRLQSTINQSQNNARLYDSNNQRAVQEIQRLQKPTGLKDEQLTQLDLANSEKDKLSTDRDTQLTTKQLYLTGLEFLKDTGFRARVIKKYLPVLNTLINKYLAALDFYVDFQVDENFDETIRSRYRDEFKYNNFSEGQKLRIDLALTFAFRDIAKMRHGMDTNLLVFDETFDSSLDDAGVDDLLKIIQANEALNIFVVSHRSENLKDMFSRTFKFTLRNNFSHVEEQT